MLIRIIIPNTAHAEKHKFLGWCLNEKVEIIGRLVFWNFQILTLRCFFVFRNVMFIIY